MWIYILNNLDFGFLKWDVFLIEYKMWYCFWGSRVGCEDIDNIFWKVDNF